MRAETAVGKVRLNYDVGDEAHALDCEARLALRRDKSMPRLEQIKAQFKAQKTEVLPESPSVNAKQSGAGRNRIGIRQTLEGIDASRDMREAKVRGWIDHAIRISPREKSTGFDRRADRALELVH